MELQDSSLCKISLQLESEGAYRAVEIGPSADSPEAAEFCQFWGEKSEMRRFQVCSSMTLSFLLNTAVSISINLQPHHLSFCATECCLKTSHAHP